MGKEYTFEVNEMESLLDLTDYVVTITTKYQEHTMAVFAATIIKTWARDHDADAAEIAERVAAMMKKAEEFIKKPEISEELMEEEAIKWIIGAGTLNNETLEN